MFDVITIGTAVRDAFVKSDQFKIIDNEDFAVGKGLVLPLGGKIDVEEIFFSTGGVATNAAVTFSRQGYSAACLSRVGDDISGEEVTRELKENNVDTSLVQKKEGLKTGYSILLLTPSGERTIITFRGASGDFPKDELPSSLESKWLYLGGSLSLDFVESILEKAGPNGTKIAMAPSKVHFKEGLENLGDILKKLTLVTMNREEAAKLTGLSYEDEKGIFSKLDEYVKNIVVMTEGPKGVLVSDGKKIYKAGIFKEKSLVDRTGAGDAFGSGFVAGLMGLDNIENVSEEQIKYAIRLASANATSVVEHIGAKEGILSKESFEDDNRWQDLDIIVS